MALTRFTEIKAELASEMNDSDIEDRLTEIAEGYIPIYNYEIVEEWSLMPEEFNDSWQEYGTEVAVQGIIRLMTLDLFAYYEAQVSRAYEELTAEAKHKEAQAIIDSLIHL